MSLVSRRPLKVGVDADADDDDAADDDDDDGIFIIDYFKNKDCSIERDPSH